MPLRSILMYLLSLAVVGAACWEALRLAKSYRHYFLSSYLGYLVAFGIVFILNLVATDLSADILKGFTAQDLVPVYILFGLVAFPLFAIAWYFLLAFAAGILDREISTSLRTAFILFWAVLFAIFLIRIQFALGHRSPPAFLGFLNIVSGLATGFIPFVIYAAFLARAARRTGPEERAGLRRFGAASLAGLFVLLAAMVLTPAGWPLRWAVPALLALGLFFPVLVLKDFLSLCYRPIPAGAFEGTGLDEFVEARGLSKREGEILGLLLRGKSNKEIERDLFISPHTVRNHIHNIYQKLGVGSRLQLMNFVREFTSGRAGS